MRPLLGNVSFDVIAVVIVAAGSLYICSNKGSPAKLQFLMNQFLHQKPGAECHGQPNRAVSVSIISHDDCLGDDATIALGDRPPKSIADKPVFEQVSPVLTGLVLCWNGREVNLQLDLTDIDVREERTEHVEIFLTGTPTEMTMTSTVPLATDGSEMVFIDRESARIMTLKQAEELSCSQAPF